MRSLLGVRLELSAVGVVLGAAFAAAAGYDATLVVGTVVAGIGMVLQATANVLTALAAGRTSLWLVTIIDIARQAVASP